MKGDCPSAAATHAWVMSKCSCTNVHSQDAHLLLLLIQVEFLQAYGLAAPDISRLLLACPELFAHCSIYESGRTLLFFKHLGYQVCGRKQHGAGGNSNMLHCMGPARMSCITCAS